MVKANATMTSPLGFTRHEWWRLWGFYGAVTLLHAVGWGLAWHYAALYPTLIGLNVAAWLFGLRHAFDADHIAAVDDTTRYLLRTDDRPLGIGFFFSLGHSSVVLFMTLATIVAATSVKRYLPQWQEPARLVATGFSGAFLWLVGLLNLWVLLGLLRYRRAAVAAGHSHPHLEALLNGRGLMNRVFGPRMRRIVRSSWQMYPLGVVFGLGFDTASEIALLALAAGAAASAVPAMAILSLPLTFAAGMTLMDTTDGVLMSRLYCWASLEPRRRIFYNIALTGLSVAVALVIGALQALQVFEGALHLRGRWLARIDSLDFSALGLAATGLFLLAWIGVAVMRRLARAPVPSVAPGRHGKGRHVDIL